MRKLIGLTLTGLLLLSGRGAGPIDNEIARMACKRADGNVPIIASASLAALSNAELEKRGDEDSASGRAALRVLGERLEQQGARTKALDYYRRAAFIVPPVRSVYSPGFGNVPGSTNILDPDDPVTIGDPPAVTGLARAYRDGAGVRANVETASKLSQCGVELAQAADGPPPYVIAMQPSATVTAQSGSPMLDNSISRFSLPSDVTGLRWSPDGASLLVSYENGTRFALLDAASGRQRWRLERAIPETSPAHRVMEFSSDGGLIYVGAPLERLGPNGEGRDQMVSVISARDAKLVRTITYPAALSGGGLTRANALVVDENRGRLLALPGGSRRSHSVIALDAADRPSPIIELPNNYPEIGKGFSPRGLAIDATRNRLWWSHAGMLQIIDLSTSKPGPETQAFQVSIQVMQVNPRTGELVAGGTSNILGGRFPTVGPMQEWRRYADDPATLVRAFDAVTAKQTRVYAGPGGSVYGISVSADGKLVAAIKSKALGKSPSVLNLWDAGSAQLLASRSFGAADVGDVAFDPKGARLAFAVDGTVHITRINP